LDDTLLIIDDEVQIRRLLEITLSANGYKIIKAGDGKEGMIAAANYQPSAIILDLGLPDADGIEILKNLRTWYQKPIIILTVRNEEEDVVNALEHGANDYLTKPFRTREMLARIRSALRHEKGDDQNSNFIFEDLEIDIINHVVRKQNAILKLTSTEFNLLSLLAKNAGRVLTHQYILREIWGHSFLEQTQYLRVFVAQIRKKIETNPSKPTLLITESGIGYRFGN
jgi:two-component system, OmpR family, KDP operon response regulator KdpE